MRRLRNTEKYRATMRTRQGSIAMPGEYTPRRTRKINETAALSLLSVHAYQNKPVSIYISFYLFMDLFYL